MQEVFNCPAAAATAATAATSATAATAATAATVPVQLMWHFPLCDIKYSIAFDDLEGVFEHTPSHAQINLGTHFNVIYRSKLTSSLRK